MFEHQFKHEVVGLETKFFWIPLSQQISFMPSTSQINLSDQEPRYWHFCDWFLWRKLLDTFSIVKLTRQYITILLQFVLPTSSCCSVLSYPSPTITLVIPLGLQSPIHLDLQTNILASFCIGKETICRPMYWFSSPPTFENPYAKF